MQGRMLTMRILHLALTASLFIYAVVIHVVLAVQKTRPPMSSDEATPILVAMAVIALGTAAIAIPIARKKMLPPFKPPEHRDDRLPEDNLPPAVGRAQAQLLTANILTWALCESIAIYGLVIGFMLQESWPYYAFAGPALALMIFFMPRRIDLEAVSRAALEAPPSGD